MLYTNQGIKARPRKIINQIKSLRSVFDIGDYFLPLRITFVISRPIAIFNKTLTGRHEVTRRMPKLVA